MQRQSAKDVKDAAILLQPSPVGSNRSSIVSSHSSNSSGYSSASGNGVKVCPAMHSSEYTAPANHTQYPAFPPFHHHNHHPYNVANGNGCQETNNHVTGHCRTTQEPQNGGWHEEDLYTVQKQEVFDWLKSINMVEAFHLFAKSGYDIATISRMTPEDLTAIGMTNPEARKRVTNEISRLRIQDDSIPAYWPGSLFYWLEMLHLLEYFDLLTSEGCSALDRLLQVTWEDFEEMKIHKLGHLKKLVLAVDRLKRTSGCDPSKAAAPPPRIPYSSIDNYLQLRGVQPTNNRDQISNNVNGGSHAIEYVPIHLNRSWSGMLAPQQEEVRPASLLVRYESFHGNPYNDFKALAGEQDSILSGGGVDCDFNDTTPTNNSTSTPLYLRESRSSIVPSPAPLTPVTQGLPPLPPISPQPSPTKNYDYRPKPPPKPKPKSSLQIGLGGRSGQDNSYNFVAGQQHDNSFASMQTHANGSASLSPSPKRSQTLVGELGVAFRKRNNSGECDRDRLSMRSQNAPPPPPKRTNSIREDLDAVGRIEDGVKVGRAQSLTCNDFGPPHNQAPPTTDKTSNQARTSFKSQPNNGIADELRLVQQLPPINADWQSNMHVGRGDLHFYADREDPPLPPPPNGSECVTLPFANENVGTMKQKTFHDTSAPLPNFKAITKPTVPAKPNLRPTAAQNTCCDVSSVFEDIDDMFAGLTEELNNLIAMQK